MNSVSKKIVRIALMAALLIVGKLALSFIPNVEVVTALTLIFACVFGWEAVAATVIFCLVDTLLYSFSLDVMLSYFTYWLLLALAGVIAAKLNADKAYVYAAIGVVGSLCFGLITAAYYCIIYKVPFLPYYLSGIPFYALQIVSALAFTLVGFTPLTKLLRRIK